MRHIPTCSGFRPRLRGTNLKLLTATISKSTAIHARFRPRLRGTNLKLLVVRTQLSLKWAKCFRPRLRGTNLKQYSYYMVGSN